MVIRARGGAVKVHWLEKSQIAYWPYFRCDSRTALLQIIVSGRDGFSLRYQRESLHGVERPVKTKEEENSATLKRFRPVGQATGLPAL